jgi:hypothetical protein
MSQLNKDESQSMKVIFINAKNNTMSYIHLDFSYSDLWLNRNQDKIDKYIYSEIGYKRLFDLEHIGFLGNKDGLDRFYCVHHGNSKITEGDVGFIIAAPFYGYDIDHFFGTEEPEAITKYDGTYDTFEDSNPNRFKGYRFVGNAVIIAQAFTSLEQLSQMVKCYYMKKRDNQDAILPRYDSIEHSSHPKIIEMAGDGKDLEQGN